MSLSALAIIITGALFITEGLTTISKTAFIIVGAAIIVLVLLDVLGVAVPGRRSAVSWRRCASANGAP